ncbi:MAG: 2,3-dehydroadipyl-CoA hydratase [Rhodospirillaceae bacterium]|nr:2,3-dehydroadipyl-CoA hydratase [Rhodospirillaceae bacterium]
MNEDSEILVNCDNEGIMIITLNRPNVKNAFSNTLISSLEKAFINAEQDEKIKCVITTGGLDVYAAGSDISQLKTRPTHGGVADIRFSNWDTIEKFSKPVVAAVNGYALGGGCELAMLADIIIAGESAKFGLPEVRLGLFPGLGGTQRLIRSVGKSLAMKVILAAEFIDASEALRNGLVAEVTKNESTLKRSIEIANKIASMPPLAIKTAKKVVLQSFETSLSSGLHYERSANLSLYNTYDKNEGVTAFLEKRKPKWKGE